MASEAPYDPTGVDTEAGVPVVEMCVQCAQAYIRLRQQLALERAVHEQSVEDHNALQTRYMRMQAWIREQGHDPVKIAWDWTEPTGDGVEIGPRINTGVES